VTSQWIVSDIVFYWEINAFYGIISVLYAIVLVCFRFVNDFLILFFKKRWPWFTLCTNGKMIIYQFVMLFQFLLDFLDFKFPFLF
jgi:hypothetical protein